MRRLIVIGAGGHGCSVAEAALLSGAFSVVGFLDDAFPASSAVWEFPVLGKISDYGTFVEATDCWIVAIGNNRAREAIFQTLAASGCELVTVIHPGAQVSPRAIIGCGSAIMAGAVIGTEAKLGDSTIVNSGAVVDHHCFVNDYGHLGVGAVMAGGSILGRSAWMQANSAIGYGVNVEAGRVLVPGESLVR